MFVRAVATLSFCLLLGACSQPDPAVTSTPSGDKAYATTDSGQSDGENNGIKQVKVKGTIRFKPMEGGFFALESVNGQKYTLMGLPKAHKRDGLIVEIEGSVNPDMMTIYQFGEPLKVTHVNVIDDSKAEKAKPVNNSNI